MAGPVSSIDTTTGIWLSARPSVLNRRAEQYNSLPASPVAAHLWQRFLRTEALRSCAHIAEMQGEGYHAMQGEGYHTAYSASIPMDREPLFGPAHVFPPYGFHMKIKLYWLAEVSAAAIDDFEWCMYQISPNRQFYLERVHHEWVQWTPQQIA